jgi:hypothetical protein
MYGVRSDGDAVFPLSIAVPTVDNLRNFFLIANARSAQFFATVAKSALICDSLQVGSIDA